MSAGPVPVGNLFTSVDQRRVKLLTVTLIPGILRKSRLI